MIIQNNCYNYETGRQLICPYLKAPVFMSGFTGKSGRDTKYICGKTKKPVSSMKKKECTYDFLMVD